MRLSAEAFSRLDTLNPQSTTPPTLLPHIQGTSSGKLTWKFASGSAFGHDTINALCSSPSDPIMDVIFSLQLGLQNESMF